LRIAELLQQHRDYKIKVEGHTDYVGSVPYNEKLALARGFMRTDLVFPGSVLRSGESLSRTVVAYLGPKNYDDLHAADAAAGFQTGFDKVVDLGWFAFIGRPLLWLLQKFQSVVGNWGIAIILLTLLVKLVLVPLTHKQMESMARMKELTPE
jgi:YidC/Oxa1 family membrane protein insertase